MDNLNQLGRGRDKKKRKPKFINSKAFEIGKNLVVGSALTATGVYGVRKGLGDDFISGLNPLNMNPATKNLIKETAQNTTIGVLGAGAVLAPTVLVAKGVDQNVK